jgi:hypothetical protein
MSIKPVACANCAKPMTLARVNDDPRNNGQQVFSCVACRLVEIRAPLAESRF